MASEILEQMKFGVEIECVIPEEAMANEGWYRGNYSTGNPIPGFTGWRLKYDCTVRPTAHQARRGCIGVEVMSPAVTGAEGIENIQAMVKKIRSLGGKVNNRCGLHVNISHRKLFRVGPIRRLINLVSRFEGAFWAMNGSVTRRDNNQPDGPMSPGGLRGWAKSIKLNFKKYENIQALNRISRQHHERYHVLNLLHCTSMTEGYKRRVEFRVFAATLNATKMTAYIRVVMGLVEVAITGSGKPAWDLVKSEREANWPDGTYAMRKLFYGPLRWYHSRPDLGPTPPADQDPRYKALGILGDDAANELDKSARALFKMARKYDEQDGWANFPRVARHYLTF